MVYGLTYHPFTNVVIAASSKDFIKIPKMIAHSCKYSLFEHNCYDCIQFGNNIKINNKSISLSTLPSMTGSTPVAIFNA